MIQNPSPHKYDLFLSQDIKKIIEDISFNVIPTMDYFEEQGINGELLHNFAQSALSYYQEITNLNKSDIDLRVFEDAKRIREISEKQYIQNQKKNAYINKTQDINIKYFGFHPSTYIYFDKLGNIPITPEISGDAFYYGLFLKIQLLLNVKNEVNSFLDYQISKNFDRNPQIMSKGIENFLKNKEKHQIDLFLKEVIKIIAQKLDKEHKILFNYIPKYKQKQVTYDITEKNDNSESPNKRPINLCFKTNHEIVLFFHYLLKAAGIGLPETGQEYTDNEIKINKTELARFLVKVLYDKDLDTKQKTNESFYTILNKYPYSDSEKRVPKNERERIIKELYKVINLFKLVKADGIIEEIYEDINRLQ